MDCCVKPLTNGNYLIQTTDFFYPLIEDPYMMGRIACANVLSDLYAMGVCRSENMLMLLGVSNRLTEAQREIIVPQLMRGFQDCATEAESEVMGGQTIFNPWMLVGGVATGVCKRSEFIMPDGAEPGDVLVLTKPLGTQVAVNTFQWLDAPADLPALGAKFEQLVKDTKREREHVERVTREAYAQATFSMARLNLVGARLMHKYKAHAATDVTGFGLFGHAQNLASVQKQALSFTIHTLPVIAHMAEINRACTVRKFKLLEGIAAETSGGLLIAMRRADAEAFCTEFTRMTRAASGSLSSTGGTTDEPCAWIVGDVVEAKGKRSATISPDARIVEVNHTPNPAPLMKTDTSSSSVHNPTSRSNATQQ